MRKAHTQRRGWEGGLWGVYVTWLQTNTHTLLQRCVLGQTDVWNSFQTDECHFILLSFSIQDSVIAK